MAVTIRWLGHSTVVLDIAGVRLVTDPLLQRHAGPLRRHAPRPDPTTYAGCDAVLLSHLHHDHAELSSLRRLTGPILTTEANARWLRRHGLPGTALAPDAEVQGVRIRQTRADHHSRPMPHRPNQACGHLVTADSIRVWVAGDTSAYPELADLAPLDLAVVPIAGWGPRLSDGHLDAAQAAQVCATVGARAVLPVHWGTLAAPLTRRLAPRGWFERPGFVLLLLTLLITLYDRYRTVRVIRERDARTPRQPVLA